MDNTINALLQQRDEYFTKHKRLDTSIPTSLYIGMGLTGLASAYTIISPMFSSNNKHEEDNSEYEYVDSKGNVLSEKTVKSLKNNGYKVVDDLIDL